MDATIFPSNAKVLSSTTQAMSTVLAMSGSKNVGHVQLPIAQSNTNTTALVTHRRKIEDGFISARLDTSNSVVLQFTRPSDSTAQDRRGGIQNG